MNQVPRDPLDADERAVAARLPRLHGRTGPDAALDARILAAAHAAVQGTPSATTRRRGRWAVPLGLAASLCLALGVAWRMQLESPPGRTPDRPVADAAPTASGRSEAAPLPSAAPPAPAPAAPTARAERAATAARGVPSTAEAQAAPHNAASSRAETVAPAALPDTPPIPAAGAPATMVPPPPPPPAPPAAMAATAPRQMVEAGLPPAAAPATESLQPMSPVPAADDAPDEDVPPATADSAAVRAAWLRRIGELLRQGQRDLARASLEEFRRRYPDAPLPPELRELLPSAPGKPGE